MKTKLKWWIVVPVIFFAFWVVGGVAQKARAEVDRSVDTMLATLGPPDQVYTIGDTTYVVYGGHSMPSPSIVADGLVLPAPELFTCKHIFTVKKNLVVGYQRKC
jgi:hypothetical protein